MWKLIKERVENLLYYTNKEAVDRLRTFKPTIKYGFWGKETLWEERDKPLTNEELKSMYGVTDEYLD